MKRSDKVWMAPLSFVPFIAIVVWAVYLLVVNGRLIEDKQLQEHDRVVTLISQNYSSVLTLFFVAFLIGLAVLIAFVVHLKKVRTMNSSTKLGWLIFMCAFGPLAFPVYYFVEVRHEPDDVAMYSSINEGAG
ncbi:MAG: hypothetical protein ABI378_09440 [Chitinophagaceae bacterium]